MHVADVHRNEISRLAVLGELRRAGRLLRGDPEAYTDLIVALEEAWAELDEQGLDLGRPLPEEEADA